MLCKVGNKGKTGLQGMGHHHSSRRDKTCDALILNRGKTPTLKPCLNTSLMENVLAR